MKVTRYCGREGVNAIRVKFNSEGLQFRLSVRVFTPTVGPPVQSVLNLPN